MKPEAFPFLRIARKYEIEYGELLSCISGNGSRGFIINLTGLQVQRYNTALYAELANAIMEQDAVRRGIIDWQTGEARDPGTSGEAAAI